MREKITNISFLWGKSNFLAAVFVLLLLLALPLTNFLTLQHQLYQQYPAGKNSTVQTMLNNTKEINYFPANSGWTYMWSRFDPIQIDTDFRNIQGLGFNTVRIMAQAKPGAFDYPSPTTAELNQLSQVVALASKHNLKVHLALFGLWSQFGDITGSKQWADAVVKPYAGDARIAFFELRNELDVKNLAALPWAQTMIPYLRGIDGGIPVTISEYGVNRMQILVNALQTTPPDFWDFHLYNYKGTIYLLLSLIKAMVSTVPLFIGETGYATNSQSVSAFAETAQNSTAQEAQQEYYFRMFAYAIQALKLPFASPWIYSDFAPHAIPPGAGTSSEQYAFGLYRLDGSAKPAVTTLKKLLAGNTIDISFNNGFEQSDGQGLPILWRTHQSASLGYTAIFAQDTTVAHSGNASARISNSSGNASGTPGFYLNPIQYVIPDQTYTLSAWTKGLNTTGSNYLSIVWFDSMGNYLSTSQSQNFPLGTFTWQQQSLSVSAPTNAAAMEIHLNSQGNTGTIWFDDVSFTTSVPTTTNISSPIHS